LTTWYAEHAVKFIETNRDKPFFLYVAHAMPHVPLFVSDKFAGKTKRGLFGDVIEEIDWSVGQILETLERLKLDDRTLVIFTSDNGPWLSYGNHAGSAAPLREGKGTAWDGGVRVPCVARWPGKIPAGTVSATPWMTIDVLPTVAKLAGAPLPAKRIDGVDASDVLLGSVNGPSPHESLLFYWGNELHAIRNGRWKLHFPHTYRTLDGEPGKDGQPGPYRQEKTELALYDLVEDIGESKNVANEHGDIVRMLSSLADEARKDLGDQLTKQTGKGVREPGRAKE
jgi:arylsulfatase A-like enzyme